MLYLPCSGDACLTVRQPYAALIVAGVKPVENRSQPTRFRGRLFITASAARPPVGSWSDWLNVPPPRMAPDDDLEIEEAGAYLPPYASLPCGAVVGSVELFDCVPCEDLPHDFEHNGYASGPYCWLFRNAQSLEVPILCKGSLGIWRWK